LSSSSSVQCWASSSSSCGLLLELGLVKWPFSWSLAGGFWFWDYSCDGLMNLCKKVREWSVVLWFASQAPAATPLSLSQLGSSPLCWQHKHNQWLSCLGTCLHGILFIPVWLLAVVLPVLDLFLVKFAPLMPEMMCWGKFVFKNRFYTGPSHYILSDENKWCNTPQYLRV
jgi:hypothetical protein